MDFKLFYSLSHIYKILTRYKRAFYFIKLSQMLQRDCFLFKLFSVAFSQAV